MTTSSSEEVERALHERDGWPEYRKLVLSKLNDLADDMREVKKDIVILKVKAAAWGLVGGSVATGAAAILSYLSKHG
jgi:hypothetical protein